MVLSYLCPGSELGAFQVFGKSKTRVIVGLGLVLF